MNTMVDHKRLNSSPINLDRCYAVHDRQAGISRRGQALLAAAGMDGPDRRWFVLTVASGADRNVASALHQIGVERWMPVANVTPPRRGGRGTNARPAYEKPVFPGYLFVRVADSAYSWAVLMSVKGVLGVLGGALQPSPVADDMVSSLRDFLAGDPQAVTILTNAVKVGDAVCVTSGPLASFPGVVERVDGKGRALIDVLIFGRSCPVELELAKIAKV